MYTSIFAVILVLLAAISDLQNRKIPNKLILMGFVTALTLQLYYLEVYGFQLWLSGATVGFLLFWPFYIVRGMAAGDVKLLMAVGAFVGPLVVLKIALVACLIGGLVAIAYLLFNRKLGAALENVKGILVRSSPAEQTTSQNHSLKSGYAFSSVGRMPYAPSIAAATVAILLTQ